jgi:hypothetical protein
MRESSVNFGQNEIRQKPNEIAPGEATAGLDYGCVQIGCQAKTGYGSGFRQILASRPVGMLQDIAPGRYLGVEWG